MNTITLTQGYATLVDDDIYDELAQFKWHVSGTAKKYAKRDVGGRKAKTSILLHRYIMDAKAGDVVDHINGNTLDNRRENLRICKQTDNSRWHIDLNKNNTSGYRGVCWHEQRGKWLATIRIARKQIHLGLFESKEDAARAYDEAASLNFGDFASLNFPLAVR